MRLDGWDMIGPCGKSLALGVIGSAAAPQDLHPVVAVEFQHRRHPVLPYWKYWRGDPEGGPRYWVRDPRLRSGS